MSDSTRSLSHQQKNWMIGMLVVTVVLGSFLYMRSYHSGGISQQTMLKRVTALQASANDPRMDVWADFCQVILDSARKAYSEGNDDFGDEISDWYSQEGCWFVPGHGQNVLY